MTHALVLGGGGIAGVAWETGVLKGLRDAGVDLTDADLIVGTSAGSIVGAQVATGVALDGMFGEQLRSIEGSGQPAPEIDMDLLMGLFAELATGAITAHELRLRLGKVAVERAPADASARLEVIMSRLPIHEWPERGLLITAVDTATAERVGWDRSSGAPLPLAVASSCAVPGVFPPVEIHGRRYMDGGIGSPTNADLASGHERVVIVAPSGAAAFLGLDDEIAGLRSAGSHVELIVPDEASMAAFGPNVLDPATRAPSARAGLAQGTAAAAALSR
jgi:NTE family protein